MSVVVYKDGKNELCDPLLLQHQLDAGWSLTKEPKQKKQKKQKKQVEAESTLEIPKED